MFNRSIEDYLKAIYLISVEDGHVTTNHLAERMSVTPASATAMLKRLSNSDLLEYEPYHGAVLTKKGMKQALTMIRHHKLLEVFLEKILGVPWDRVGEEAHRIEHAITPYIESRIDAVLGSPSHCPHGYPIPTADGLVGPRATQPLTELNVGTTVAIQRVNDEDTELLRYFGKLGLYPGTTITITNKDPFDGPITFLINDEEKILGYQAAKKIYV